MALPANVSPVAALRCAPALALLLALLGACSGPAGTMSPSDDGTAAPSAKPATPQAQTPPADTTTPSAPEPPVVRGEDVQYVVDGTTFKGYLAYDQNQKGPRPGVLVVHEWWGHNEYARQRARKLAALGYTALALDMYGDGKTAAHPADAGKFSGAVRSNLDAAQKRFEAAKALLQAHGTTDPEQVAVIGYCFGGGIALEMARRGLDLDAVVSFHGTLAADTPAAAGAVKGEVFVFHGAADPFVKPASVAAFKQEMADAGATLHFVSYPGVKHAFTNPGATELGKRFDLPLEYDAAADADAWQKMQAGLGRIFGE